MRGRLAILVVMASACAPAAAPVPPPALPPHPVEQIAEARPREGVPPRPSDEDPLARLPPGDPVTLTAADVDVAALLLALSETLGASLILDPEIGGRISVNFVEVPAREALRVVLEQAGLFIAPGPPSPPWGPVVFYTAPVDIETASVELIQARFNVSRAVAEMIVNSRVRR